MYDMAKRSLAFTVATGGLLLTGTGYAPADTASIAPLPGQAQAQESGSALKASPSSVSTPISVREDPQAQPKAAAQAPQARAPQQPRTASSGGGANASAVVDHSRGVLSGNTVQIPINLGLNLCGNQVDAVAVQNKVDGSDCSFSSGATATSSTNYSGGLGSGNTIQVPVNIPLNVCGNQAILVGVANKVAGGKCSTTGAPDENGSTGGANATATTSHSGGILSGNIIQAPVNVPINACGNQAILGGLKNKDGSTTCENGGTNGPSGTGATAMGSVSDSRGVLSGNIVQTPINVPVNACDNQAGGIAVNNTVGGTQCTTTEGGPGGSSATSAVVNSGGLGSGNTAQTPINVPVNACGNSANAIAFKNTNTGGTCTTGGSTSATSATVNSGGVVSGNSGQVPITVPANVCGNTATVGGVANNTGGAACTIVSPTVSSNSVVVNSGGIGSGNQPTVPIIVPVNVCGDTAAVGGVANNTGAAECSETKPSGTPSATPPGGPGGSPSPSATPPGGPGGSPSATPPGGPGGSPSATPPGGPGGSPSASPPGSPAPSGHGAGPGGLLAHTGSDEVLVIGAAGAALLAGLGVRTASRRRRTGGR